MDGLVPPERRAAMESHLAECADCARLADAVGATHTQATGSDLRGQDELLQQGARVGRYEILARLGAGAMGTVYAAHDPALDRKVALKLIRAQVAGPELEARLLREAKAMARLSHPDVIAVHDAGRDGERLFIAMELVDGGTLRQWLVAKRRSWREVLAVYLRAGRGLEQAHASGLVHRDFKPDNVLIGKDGRVRVTDFGLARGLEGEGPESRRGEDATEGAGEEMLTRTGALVGTPAYMAPEQLEGSAADARSDVYAFCVSLYEALYGERPFGGKTLPALRGEKHAGVIRPPSTDRRVPAGLRRVLLGGLRARPEERYASMGELLAALERAARWRRAPMLAGAAVVAIVAGALVMRAASAPKEKESAAVPVAVAVAECATNRACVESHGGAPFVCRASDKTCVPIATEDCTPMFEPRDLVAEDTVWLGAMFPLRGPATGAYGPMNMAGADFARREIAQATRALDGTNASKHVPRIALVGCDDSADPMRAAKHLVDDVGVPAILGFRSGQEIVDVAGGLLIGRGVLTVASLTSSPLITRLPQPGDLPRMVWRTTYSSDFVAEAIARIVPDVLEPRSHAATTRITLVRSDMTASLSFGDAFYRRLRFNGKTALENGHDYQEVTLPAAAPSASEIEGLASSVASRQPAIVVLLADPGATVALVEAIEARAARFKPTYVVAVGSTGVFASFLGKNADRRHRVYAVESESSSLANARFVIRYNQAHEKQQVTRTFNPGASYDAFYLLANGVFALGGEKVTGPALAKAFQRLLPPGLAIEVGPPQVFEAITELSAGRSIDLEGTQSGLDFDPARGEAPSDIELLCPGVDADGQASAEDVSAGVVYRARAGKVEGSIRCP